MAQSPVPGLSVVRWLAGVLLIAACVTIQASADLFVDSDWLAERSDNPNVVVLEVRYYPHRYYTIGHIPGAPGPTFSRPRRQQWTDSDALSPTRTVSAQPALLGSKQ